MADIPPRDDLSVIEDEITNWKEAETQLEYWKEKELELRMSIFKSAFPVPVVGANKIRIGHGMALVGTHRINYKVDKPAIINMYSDNRELVDRVINFRPEVKEGEYKKLTSDDLKKIAAAITETPGTPALEVKSASKVRW